MLLVLYKTPTQHLALIKLAENTHFLVQSAEYANVRAVLGVFFGFFERF
jgi:hypothetical protein